MREGTGGTASVVEGVVRRVEGEGLLHTLVQRGVVVQGRRGLDHGEGISLIAQRWRIVGRSFQ